MERELDALLRLIGHLLLAITEGGDEHHNKAREIIKLLEDCDDERSK